MRSARSVLRRTPGWLVRPAKAVLRPAKGPVLDLAIRAGLMPYRPMAFTPENWEDLYQVHGLGDRMGDVNEVAHYSILVGYVQFLGGEPDLLDVGCGTGLLRARLGSVPFRRYVGVDPTPTAIVEARRWEDERTVFVVGDPLAYEDDAFDIVFCNEVLYEVPDVGALLEWVVRVLKPGGHLLTSIWRHPGDTWLWRQVDSHLQRVDLVEVRNPANPMASRGWRVACHRRPDEVNHQQF